MANRAKVLLNIFHLSVFPTLLNVYMKSPMQSNVFWGQGGKHLK